MQRCVFKNCYTTGVVALLLFAAATSSAQIASSMESDLPNAPSVESASRADWLTKEAQVDTTQAPAQSSSSQKDDRGDAAPQKTPLQQQQRLFGVMPNFTTISAGTKPVPAGWKTDFKIANRQNYDYTSVSFLFITSSIAYVEDSHPSLDTVNGGNAPYWAYLWRGFLDKTDGTYQGTFFFPALLHEDTRYYAMGSGPIKRRTLHAVAALVVAHNYRQKPIFNAAGLLGKVGTQAVSTTYYPAGSEDFGVLAEKFTYSCLRQIGFTVLREFSPDLNALLHHHRPNSRPATAAVTP